MEEEISLNGYTFELDRSVPRLGDYIGEAGNLPAVIRKINVTNKTLSEVSVEVITARAEGVTYRYSYKKEVEEDTEYQQVAEKEENTNTYSGLESQVVYNLKVELIKDGDVIDEEVVNVMLGEIEEGSLTFGKESWSNGTASLPVSTTTNMQIQYQINGIEEGKWTTISGNSGNIPNIANGADVYARLWDGTNGSEYISRRIEDMTPPTVDISTSNLTDNSVTLNVTASDEQSGLATSGTYTYYLNDEQKETSTTNSYTYTGLTAVTKYTLKVIVIDNAGKTTEKSTTITTMGMEDPLPSEPKLTEGMTPVKWNGSNWIKTTESDENWYNYAKKEWANVVLGDATFSGNTLDESEPYSMLVWIPRYAYKITSGWNSRTTGTIDVIFVDENNKSKSGTTYNGTYNGSSGTYSNYVVHPAFNYGNSNENKLRGLWVGKYETSNTDCTTTESTGRYNGTSKTIQIKAGVTSWRSITVSNIYTVCTEMNKSGNPYGLSTSDSVVDPHMMKNTEWGAVAYLSKSKYGKQTEEVWKNPNSNRITGQAGSSVSASSTTSTTDYKSTNGQKASTTGNTTGVYDMSGGASEYVAAYVNNEYSYLQEYGANLVNAAAKYKDVYSVGSSDSQSNNYAAASSKYGDAVYETSSSGTETNSWYSDYSNFPSTSSPFFPRGGGCNSSGSSAGVFYFGSHYGGTGSDYGFRVVVPVL